MRSEAKQCILITGATSAIGSALATEYASPGRRLLLQGRNADKLRAIVEDCQRRGAEVQPICLDLTDREALSHWLHSLGGEQPPGLVIVNAGVNTNTRSGAQGEPWPEVEALLEVNVRSALALVSALLPAMRKRGTGQIALMSSLAAFHGLPVTPSYCASKAALQAYGQALRAWLAPEGIRVNVIMPGFVDSAMCRRMPGPKPLLWKPDRAARAIRKGLERNTARIAFPWLLAHGSWWLSVLPAPVSQRIVGWVGYGD